MGDIDAIDLNSWGIGAPIEEKTFRLVDDKPEVMEALKKAGYEGDIWLKLRNLTAAEKDDRDAEAVEFTRGRAGAVLRSAPVREYHVHHMVVDGRFPVWRNDAWREYVWDKSPAGPGRNHEKVLEMGDDLLAWFNEKLIQVLGADTDEQVAEAGNSSETQANS